MANYAKTYTSAQMLQPTEVIPDTKIREYIAAIIGLINTEYDAAVSGQDGYTVTSGLQASMEFYLKNMSNVTRRRMLRDFMTVVVAEFTSAGDGSMFNYTVTSGLKASMQECVKNFDNVIVKNMLFELIDRMFVEFTAMAAAS